MKRASSVEPELNLSWLASLSEDESLAYINQLSDEQAFALMQTWAFRARPNQKAPPGDWVICLWMAGRGYGKLLDIQTPIPTPAGWTKMGDLQVGDWVLDENGCPVQVTWVSDEQTPEVSYRLTFSDGSVIDACSEHQWVTWTYADRKAYLRSPYENTVQFPDDWVNWRLKKQIGKAKAPKAYPDAAHPKVRTTQQIVDSFRQGKRGDLNHCIPQCRPLQLPEADLPIPPYTLGLWLADGTALSGSITKHEDDLPFLRQQFLEEGFQTTDRSDIQQFGVVGLTTLLRKHGLLGNKHIPVVYLRASVEQRLALLQGLLDGDGYVGENNYCEFSNTNSNLASGVYELLVSLGMRVNRKSKIPTLNGVACTKTTVLSFIPTMPVFRLPRKKDRLRFDRSQSLRRYHRMIVSYERIASPPMRCITVDSPNSLYLAGEAMIPTHNTQCLTGWLDEKARANPGRRLALVAATAADARDVLVKGESGLLEVAPAWDVPHYSPTYRRVSWSNGSTGWLYSAEEASRLRGPQHHFAVADEIAAWSDFSTWDMLLMGLRLGSHPQLAAATTPKPCSLIKTLVDESKLPNPTTLIISGSTWENAANLAKPFLNQILSRYHGSRLGEQEIEGKLLEDQVGALWKSWMFELEGFRVAESDLPVLNRKVVSVDPAVSTGRTSNQTGIIVAGAEHRKLESSRIPLKHFYVLEDLSLSAQPEVWVDVVVKAYREHGCDKIVAEGNQGGNLVSSMIATIDPNIPVEIVKASVSKEARAEPIAHLYAQGRAHHVNPPARLKDAEDQMLNWIPGSGESPDRLDAIAWAGHALILNGADEEPLMRQARVTYNARGADRSRFGYTNGNRALVGRMRKR